MVTLDVHGNSPFRKIGSKMERIAYFRREWMASSSGIIESLPVTVHFGVPISWPWDCLARFACQHVHPRYTKPFPRQILLSFCCFQWEWWPNETHTFGTWLPSSHLIQNHRFNRSIPKFWNHFRSLLIHRKNNQMLRDETEPSNSQPPPSRDPASDQDLKHGVHLSAQFLRSIAGAGRHGRRPWTKWMKHEEKFYLAQYGK